MIMFIKILFNYQCERTEGERAQDECVVRADEHDTYILTINWAQVFMRFGVLPGVAEPLKIFFIVHYFIYMW